MSGQIWFVEAHRACPLLGVNQTSLMRAPMSANAPKRTSMSARYRGCRVFRFGCLGLQTFQAGH